MSESILDSIAPCGAQPYEKVQKTDILAPLELLKLTHRTSTPDVNMLHRSKYNSENIQIGSAIQKFFEKKKNNRDKSAIF